MNRLQVRLIAAFLVVILVTLCITGMVWMLVLRTQPVPIDETVNELTAVLLDVNFIEEWQDFRQENRRPERGDIERFAEIVESRAGEHRVLITRGNSIVIYDSENHFMPEERLEIAPYQPRFITQRERLNIALGAGVFKDKNEDEWVFSSQRFVLRDDVNAPPALEVLIAQRRPDPDLRYILDIYGGTFLLPLCQAGVIGIGIALLLSFWLSRSVARPLQTVAKAASQVAQGNYNLQVPVKGPAEIQMVARAFNGMTQQVKNTGQAQNDFIANVAHDLRTPLTSIQGFAQSVTDGVTTRPEEMRHAARVIYEEASRMARLVTDLLDIAKIQAGKMQMLRHAVELDRVLTQVGSSLALKAKEKGIDLHLDIPPLFRIAGDGDRLAQAFTNLVDNAIKHTESGGHVWLRAQPQHGGIQVQIQDTGEGIPSEDVARIFERFYRVDKSRNRSRYDGTGLGLAIAYEVIKAHNGQIQVASEMNVGTVFIVWLPVLGSDRSTIITRTSQKG